jgi:hypothetical protein
MLELLVFLIVSAMLIAFAFVAQRRVGGYLGQLLFLAICLRILGATLRLEVIEHAYGGGSDAKSYFRFGQAYAERMAQLDFSFFLGDDRAITPKWWGTQFIRSVSAVVIFLIGPNLRAIFLVFSCFSFFGQYLIVEAFGNAFGRERRADFARWCWFWPSLWFWPSSIGKEALLTFGLGLFTWGYVGRWNRPDWRALLGGLALAAAVRPHVAMIFALSIGVAELLRGRASTSRGRVINALAVLILAGLSVRFGLSQLGLADADLEGIEEYFEHRAFSTEQGGSRIYRARGPLAVPIGLVNVLFRPFPWEARGMQLLSGAEIWVFWFILYRTRRGLSNTLRNWRANRFMIVAAPLGLALSLLYGLAFANMGIIARQRVLMLPFLISLLAIPRTLARTRSTVENGEAARFGIREGPRRRPIP